MNQQDNISEHGSNNQANQQLINQQLINEQQFSDDYQSDQQLNNYHHHTHQNQQQEQQQKIGEANRQAVQQKQQIVTVKNPVSPYMMLVKGWKADHPDQKMNISLMGQIWNKLDQSQKSVYETKYRQQKAKYDQYVAVMMLRDPNFGKKSGNSNNNKLIFPMHRVRAIMKQDKFYSTTAENITAMTQSVEYFGQYLLQQIKKTSQGKKRVDATQLFDCINANQTNLWFLNCLIDEYNDEHEANKKAVQHGVQSSKKDKEKTKQMGKEDKNNQKIGKSPGRPKQNKNNKAMLKGQMKLTDMF